MSKYPVGRPNSLIPLPAGSVPAGFRCVEVLIPDSDDYLVILAGALRQLALWSNYERDDSHKGTLVAQAWRNAIFNTDFGACMNIQFMVCEDACGIAYSTDGGENWTCLDLTQCIGSEVLDIIDQLQDQGTLPRGTQPGPSNPPDTGECTTYHGRIEAGNTWLLPVQLSEGDSVTIQAAVGGWNDGGQLEWRCPSGDQYILGQCNSANRGMSPGDPMPSSWHMRVIGKIGLTYVDCLDNVYEVPAGVTNAYMTVQANDSDLSNNKGGIEFDVLVCRGGWKHVFDFAVSQQGWAVSYGVCDNPQGSWVAGQGWWGTEGGCGKGVSIETTFPDSAHLMHISLRYKGYSIPRGNGYIKDGAGNTLLTWDNQTAEWNLAEANLDGTVSRLILCLGNGCGGSDLYVAEITIWGVGANPFI